LQTANMEYAKMKVVGELKKVLKAKQKDLQRKEAEEDQGTKLPKDTHIFDSSDSDDSSDFTCTWGENELRDNILSSGQELKDPSANIKIIVHDLLEQAEAVVRSKGNRAAWLVDAVSGDSVLYSSVGDMSRKAAYALDKLGFERGDILHIACSSSLDFFWPVLGAWLCGGSTSIGNPAESIPVIRTQLEDTKARMVVCSKDYADKFAGVIKDCKFKTCLLVLNSEPEDKLPAGAVSFKFLLKRVPAILPIFCNPDDSTLIFWTSDSSGHPMGVVRSLEFPGMDDPSAHQTMLMSPSFFIDNGFYFCLYHGLRDRHVVVFIPEGKFDGKSCLKYVKKYQANFLYLATEHFIKLSQELPINPSKYKYKCLEGISSVGKDVNNAAVRKLSLVFDGEVPILRFYGKTELLEVAIMMGINSESKSEHVLGYLWPGSQAYIADTKTGKKLGPGEIGIIMVKTKYMMLNYLNRPNQTKLFFDKDGFGNTGDLGYYDSNRNLFLCGSVEDVMRVDHCQFGPEVIENVLEAIEDIGEAQVWGERIASTGNDIVHARISFCKWAEPWTKEKIREFANSRLPPSQHITGNIFVMDNLPHTLEGEKVRRERPNPFL